MKLLTLIIMLFFPMSACTSNGELVTNKLVNPVLNMEVVTIPTEGKVVQVYGNPQIKKKNINEYKSIVVGTIISEEDMVWLKERCIAKIEFTDGTYILNEPQDHEVYITFELSKSSNVLK